MLGSCSQKFTAHYACRNADLNLILVLAMTNGFIMSYNIIDSLWNLVEYISPRLSVIAGCKESQFYSLPFGQAVASMY